MNLGPVPLIFFLLFPQQGPDQQKQDPQQPAVPPVAFDVIVTAPRVDVPLKESPAATSVVTEDVLESMPRGVAAEEALSLVPGVKVDNQANGERVHVSIRGQGLLTERGIRGIKVLLDGLPLNDPTGFAPDLFDVDWPTVSHIEVFRGPSSALYGGGAAGGVINITTREGDTKTAAAGVATIDAGSNAFWKALAEAGGQKGSLNYRVSASHNQGDGYRVHTAFDATNLYGKLRWDASPSLRLTTVVAGTSFFNENAEGLNLAQVEEDPTQPNPDALTYNEYQRTHRFTGGVSGLWTIARAQDIEFSAYMRHTNWTESVPSFVQHRGYDTPGAIVQYRARQKWDRIANQVTAGLDVDWQGIDDVKYPNLGNAVEGPDPVADQRITQRSVGLWALDRVEFGPKWAVQLDVRGDNIQNQLADNLMAGGLDLSGEKTFSHTTGRVGGSYTANQHVGLYASWGQGFLPPATEELANNPAHPGGFNENLVPATSVGEEVGARGLLHSQFSYDLTFFHLATENDFGRYRVPGRPLETFYRNAGSSRRYGIESAIGWYPAKDVAVRGAYTFNDFKYTNIKSLFGDFSDKVMPNSPRHQLTLDGEYTWNSRWIFGVNAYVQSSWFVDQTNAASVDGFALIGPRVGFQWKSGSYRAEILFSIRNLLNVDYIAFTEPDPDGNSYQPGPRREYFVGGRVWLAPGH